MSWRPAGIAAVARGTRLEFEIGEDERGRRGVKRVQLLSSAQPR